ncbi:MAG: hypothetical protein D6775_01270 [Caldilineae bacterium]|nr:MAG: hypothetical protein D6775_01270 [Caldilineae bacterium]
MPRSVLALVSTLLEGLVEGSDFTAAAVVLAESAGVHPHVLARAGRLTGEGWRTLLLERRPDLLRVPLRPRGESEEAAVLVAHRLDGAGWREEDRRLLKAFALAIDHLLDVQSADFGWQELAASRRLLRVTEEELAQLILNLHDGPVQKLFAAMNHLSILQDIVDEAGPEDAQVPLQRCTGLLEAALSEIRVFLTAFHSPNFAERDILELLRSLVLQQEQLTGLRVHYQTAESLPPAPVSIKIALYRILQEALANVWRHAGVDECFVHVWAHQDWIYLEVWDHGKGFAPPPLTGPQATEASQHIGLRGMRERVHLVGGELRVESAPNMGTKIHVRVPTYE